MIKASMEEKEANGELTQSMKGHVPRDCLISVDLHLLATRSHGRTDSVLSVVSAGIHGAPKLLVILCLNIYPRFIDADVIRMVYIEISFLGNVHDCCP